MPRPRALRSLVLVVPVVAALLTVDVAEAPRAAAAPSAARIMVDRLDPLQTRPVLVQVAALDQQGDPVAFRGTVTLTVGGTSASAPVSAAAGAVAVARVDTSRLRDGSATLRTRLAVGGRRVVQTLRWFADIAAPVHVIGFSCTAIPPGGGPIRWAVDRLNGDPVLTPNSRDVPLLPYVPSSTARWTMTGPEGRPLRTSGTVTILQGAKKVAVRPLPSAVRRLVFGGTWDGRVGGAFRPGAYTARLTLQDAAGRTAVAEQQVQVVPKGVVLCGG